MKNTNGPWINTTDGEANFYGIATNNDWLFRIQQNGSLSLDEQEANAKLIAVAPELLEASKKAIKLMQRSDFDKQLVRDLLNQVIKKAS